MTTSLVSQDPASVLILRSCLMGHVLQCLGRHLQLTSVDVDPGSNNTLSKVCDLTDDMALINHYTSWSEPFFIRHFN
jgi:hypothetical protein